jgi:hypothetical protein
MVAQNLFILQVKLARSGNSRLQGQQERLYAFKQARQALCDPLGFASKHLVPCYVFRARNGF